MSEIYSNSGPSAPAESPVRPPGVRLRRLRWRAARRRLSPGLACAGLRAIGPIRISRPVFGYCELGSTTNLELPSIQTPRAGRRDRGQPWHNKTPNRRDWGPCSAPI